MRSNIIEQGTVILFGEREDNISKFYTRIKDLTKLDWSKESYSSFSAMIRITVHTRDFNRELTV